MIKLDMSIMYDVDIDCSCCVFVKGFMSFVYEIGSVVVVEGVEIVEEFNVLVSFGVDLVQGYFFVKLMGLVQVLVMGFVRVQGLGV